MLLTNEELINHSQLGTGEILPMNLLEEDPAVILATIGKLSNNEAMCARLLLANRVIKQHALAIQESVGLEDIQVDDWSTEVSRLVSMPKLIGAEACSLMGIQRMLSNRQLAPHPDNENKLLLVARRVNDEI